MKYERLEFPEVAKLLAKKAGVILPERKLKGSEESISMINGMYKIHEIASTYFQNMLMSPNGKRAREYLTQRGLRSDTINKFKLGFATDSWDGLLIYLRRVGFREELIEKSGLIISKSEKNGYYDRFRNRLIFPIFNQRDKIIAFAGRVLDNSLPKYMNSPETPIYNKSRTLFGLNFAKKDINEKDAAVIVEGYMDLMIPYQSGMKNVVATCGTALTPEHVRLLKRHSHNVIMVYDSDKAGQLATLKSLDLLVSEDMHVEIAQLPRGLDPDSFIRNYGIEAFQGIVKKRINLFEYKLSILTSVYGTENITARAKIASEMLKTISKVNNAILRSEYVKKLAESLDLDEDSLRAELKKVKKEYKGAYNIETIPFKDEKVVLATADKIIIGMMIEDNNLILDVREKLDYREFCNEYAQQIAEFIFRSYEQNKSVTYTTLISHLDINGLDNLLAEIAATHSIFADKRKNLEDCILWIKRNNLKRNLSELHNRIKEAQSGGEEYRVIELVAQYNKLVKESVRFSKLG
jgi:DNA primase